MSLYCRGAMFNRPSRAPLPSWDLGGEWAIDRAWEPRENPMTSNEKDRRPLEHDTADQSGQKRQEDSYQEDL